jgi:hypothetical protein
MPDALFNWQYDGDASFDGQSALLTSFPTGSTVGRATFLGFLTPDSLSDDVYYLLYGVARAGAALSALVSAKTGASGSRLWAIKLTNAGSAMAMQADVTGLILTQVAGAACTPRLASMLPVQVGNIAPGSSSAGLLNIDFTGCPANARFTATIGFSANNGTLTGSKVLYNQFR